MEYDIISMEALELDEPTVFAKLLDVPASALYMIESEEWILA